MEPLRPRRRATADANLTPMIDVVFLLVLFFMLTATFARDERALELQLPPSHAAAATTAPEDLVLELDAAGGLHVAGAPVALDALPELLEAHATDGTRVVLRADAAVPHGRVVEVLDACRARGITSLAIATAPPT